MDTGNKGLTRRSFIEASAIGACAALVGGTVASTAGKVEKAKATTTTPETDGPNADLHEANPIEPMGVPAAWTGEADVVIVGGGGAGLSAAVTAAQAGGSVVVLEKNAFCGGDTSIAMLFEGFVPSRWLKSLGLWGDVLDDPKLIADRVTGASATVVYGIADAAGADDPDIGLPVAALAPSLGADVMGIQDAFNNLYTPTPVSGRDAVYMATVMKQQAETINWFQDDMGVQFSTQQVAGLPIPGIMHCPIDPKHPDEDWEYWDPHNGRGFTEPLYDKAFELGVTFCLSTPVDHLVAEGNKVVGVHAVTADGSEVYYKANKGVLLTAGGYAANQDMLYKYAPRDRAESVRCWSMTGAQGEGIRMAQGMGATTRMMQDIEMWDGGANRQLGSHGVYSAPNQLVRQKSLTVNKLGKRFFNESQYRGYYFSYQNAMTVQQPDHVSATLFDANCINKKDIIEKFSPWVCEYPCNWFESDFEKYLAEGIILKADSIAELAEKLEFPADTLQATVDRYNELCDNGYDEDFYKESQYLIPLKTPPFYAVKQMGGSCFATWGGLRVDENFNVLKDDFSPIEGLFSAGENVAGGSSLAFCLPGGRLAAWKILGAEPDHTHEQ